MGREVKRNDRSGARRIVILSGEHEELEGQAKRQCDLRSREISREVGQLSAVRCPLAGGEESNRGRQVKQKDTMEQIT